MKIFDAVFKYLTTDDVEINAVDADDPDLNDYNFIPDAKNMSDQLKVCLQEGKVKGNYVSIHSSGFRDFLLKPEVLRAIVDCGFEHPGVVRSAVEPEATHHTAPPPPVRGRGLSESSDSSSSGSDSDSDSNEEDKCNTI